MTDFNDPHGLRAFNAEKRARAKADRLDRAARLAPEVISYWTEIIRQAAPQVGAGQRPCDYAPWVGALREARRVPPYVGTQAMGHFDRYPDLMTVAEDIARPGWPDPRPDLIEYALTFIEADVMLFRSGYTKRHLARRLQQSPLTDSDVDRIERVMRRAVTDGTGLEEFRGYAKLAAHLEDAGRLPGFADWLESMADGAILTLDQADGAEWRTLLLNNPRLSDLDKARLSRVNWFGPSKWGIVWPDINRIAEAGKGLKNDDANKKRKNAYRMLRAIQRRKDSSLAARTMRPGKIK